jgi:hypothetical protein
MMSKARRVVSSTRLLIAWAVAWRMKFTVLYVYNHRCISVGRQGFDAQLLVLCCVRIETPKKENAVENVHRPLSENT